MGSIGTIIPQKPLIYKRFWTEWDAAGKVSGGRGGIRTHGTLAGTPVFKTGALNHSATLPLLRHQALGGQEIKNGL
jgi:hypothetical protein